VGWGGGGGVRSGALRGASGREEGSESLGDARKRGDLVEAARVALVRQRRHARDQRVLLRRARRGAPTEKVVDQPRKRADLHPLQLVARSAVVGARGAEVGEPNVAAVAAVAGRHEQRVVKIDVAVAQPARVHPRASPADGKGHVQHARRRAPRVLALRERIARAPGEGEG
jgi:hypothetical protein